MSKRDSRLDGVEVPPRVLAELDRIAKEFEWLGVTPGRIAGWFVTAAINEVTRENTKLERAARYLVDRAPVARWRIGGLKRRRRASK